MTQPNHKGFSLLEVMLVLALLGGIATLVMGVLPGDRKPEQAAAHLRSQLQWAAERATVEGQAYGLAVASQQWQWLKLVRAVDGSRSSPGWPGWHWQPAGASLAAPRQPLPAQSRLQLTLEENSQPLQAMLPSDGLLPQILLLPGGEISRFELQLIGDGEEPRPIALEPLR